MEIFKQFTPIVEVYSIDEAFLDVSGSLTLFGRPEAIARDIKKQIYKDFRITCSVGIAPNKLLAKLASKQQKPNGLTVIRQEDVPTILENLPVKKLFGIGGKTENKLAGYGIVTCGQLARFPVKSLKKRFGVLGECLHQMALGIDDSPVIPPEETEDVKSIGHSTTLDKDVSDSEEIRRQILRLAEMVGRRARRHHYAGRTITLTIRYSDFTSFSKRRTIKEYIDQGLDIYQLANRILEETHLKQAVRLIGVTLSNFGKVCLQLSLFDPQQKSVKFVEAMDKINDHYGEFTITYGRLLHCRKHSRIISPSYRPHGAHMVDVV